MSITYAIDTDCHEENSLPMHLQANLMNTKYFYRIRSGTIYDIEAAPVRQP